MVFNPPPEEVAYFSLRERRLPTTVSAHHTPGAFREAARATNARFIACQAFGRTEIGEWIFSNEAPAETGHRYEIVTPTGGRGLRETFNGWRIVPCSFSCEKTTLGLLAQAFAARPDPGEESTILHRSIRNLGISQLSCP